MLQSAQRDLETSNESFWIRIREETFGEEKKETSIDKFVRKCKENPVVPIGTIVAVTALSNGLRNFYLGNTWKQQQMMRLRVAAQAITIVFIGIQCIFAIKE